MKPYEKYKATGIDWVGDIPSHWDLKRLKYVAMVQPSNVDKKINEGETSVLLCNYMDVYKNEFIDDSISFMEATATESEIEKFKLEKGDVLVTKDSETPDDIANPACVKSDFENVICAYHLTQIRPDRRKLLGEYLFRLFQENNFKAQFEVAANGVTRYGLSVSSFTDAFIPLPSIEEQIAIADYLNEKALQIDKLISNKQRLIELLKEERIVVINDAVIGNGKNWKKVKFNHYIRLRHGYQFMNYDFTTTGIKVVKITQLSPNGFLDLSKATYIDESRLNEFQDILIYEGDILMALTGGTIGKIIRVGKVDEPLLQNYRVGNFFPANNKIEKDFMFWVLSSEMILSQIFYEQRETGQPNIGKENFNSFLIYLPPFNEQAAIIQHIQTETQRIDNLISKMEGEIELMNEYRTALISEVVTGKIKII